MNERDILNLLKRTNARMQTISKNLGIQSSLYNQYRTLLDIATGGKTTHNLKGEVYAKLGQSIIKSIKNEYDTNKNVKRAIDKLVKAPTLTEYVDTQLKNAGVTIKNRKDKYKYANMRNDLINVIADNISVLYLLLGNGDINEGASITEDLGEADFETLQYYYNLVMDYISTGNTSNTINSNNGNDIK